MLEKVSPNKCCNCKYFEREKIRQSRSGQCTHERWNSWGGKSPLLGCGTHGCSDFVKKQNR